MPVEIYGSLETSFEHNGAMTSDVLIRLKGVHRRFGDREKTRSVLKGVNLEVSQGEMVCLTGRSGAGKTTLVHIVAGLERADEGEVLLGGHSLGRLGEGARAHVRAQMVGIVFQAFNLLEHLTVGENVMLPAAFMRGRKESPRVRAEEVLETVGLEDRFQTLPTVLSGGERQRVALARALFAVPSLLICDEVTANLDDETAGEIISLIDRACREENVAVLAVTHDKAMVRLADRQLRLEGGRLIEEKK